ncbi:hypothetical protein NGM36_27615 [Streptomyces mutabilis]|uniref:hypothetical protein n=1 Tax=Streptomyces mutabilis TaxID=67332 RepID=UPI0022BA3AC0|nr:hypothetical protein [Streptomyces mutabilis]MCZ9353491.1 hypothetical protein [Streptomyces mutabilis]
MKTRIAGLTTTALAAIAVFGAAGSAQAADPATDKLIAAYTAEMTALVEKGDAQAAETLSQFKALTADEQARFITLVNDPELFKKIFEASETAPAPGETRTRTLAGGDVVVKQESSSSMTRATTRWASHTNTDYVLGVKVSGQKVITNYVTSGTDTTRVNPGQAMGYEYIPGCSLTHGVVDEWISAEPADNAHSETVWTAECASSWDGRQRVWGDYRGYVGGYLKLFN